MVHLQHERTSMLRENYKPLGANSYYIGKCLKNRIKEAFTYIFTNKVFLKKTTSNRVYYHSGDIFREVGAESANQDSEKQLGEVERELQKMKISDFTDVTDSDKVFLILWNQLIHAAKKENPILTEKGLFKVLKQLVTKLGKDQRLNLMTHLWALWSLGKITKYQVLQVLTEFDSCVGA